MRRIIYLMQLQIDLPILQLREVFQAGLQFLDKQFHRMSQIGDHDKKEEI